VYSASATTATRQYEPTAFKLKSEVDRRKTFKYWRVPFMDVNQLAAAGFFFTNRGDVVRCAFCGVEVGHWVEGNDAF
jgi:hypothetical protein